MGLRYFPTAPDSGCCGWLRGRNDQVIAHDIDNHGRKHQRQRYPEIPIMMRAFPVRTLAMMNAVAILLAVVVVTALILIHWFPAF